MTSLNNIKVYATHPHTCSYLEGELATTLFIDPEADINPSTYSELADYGFRRSGSHIYKPQCENCNACIPVRVNVNDYRPKRKHRKVLNKNLDLTISETETISDDEFYNLYADYINSRHADGDMYPPNREQYDSFLNDKLGITTFIEMRLGSKLVAVAVVDIMEQGLSAIYTFFQPDLDKRSIGTFAILWQIQEAQRLGLDYVYLGYWIKNCQKMSYKTDFRPLELFINGRWLNLR